jgi:hypothetical protein
MKHFSTICLLSVALISTSAFAQHKDPKDCKKPSQDHNDHVPSVSDTSRSSSVATGGSVRDSGNSSSTSNATGGRSTATGGNSTSSNTNSNTASGGAGGAGGAGGQGGTATSTGGAGGTSSANNSLQGAISNNQVYQQVRQAPSAYAPDSLPSAPCRVSGSAGASSPFGGVSLGGSKLDKECDRRETARAFALLGNKLAAAKILCNTKAAKEAQLTWDECQNYATGYFGDGNDADGPVFKAPKK